MSTKTYDPKCYELALLFLHDHLDKVPALMAEELARQIQQAIEDFLEDAGLNT